MKLRNHEIRNDEMDLIKNINKLVSDTQQLDEFDRLAEIPLKIILPLPLCTVERYREQRRGINLTKTVNVIKQIEEQKDYFNMIKMLCENNGFKLDSIELKKETNTINLVLS